MPKAISREEKKIYAIDIIGHILTAVHNSKNSPYAPEGVRRTYKQANITQIVANMLDFLQRSSFIGKL